MDDKTYASYEWALNAPFHSVAADNAKILAEYIKSLGAIEENYPNWRVKFDTLVEAIKWHTASQDKIIEQSRGSNKLLREEVDYLRREVARQKKIIESAV